MPYRKSEARKDFDAAIDGYIEQARNVSSLNNLSPDIVQAVYRSVIFQSHAALEEFVRMLFENWFFKLQQHNCNIALLPKEIVSLSYFDCQQHIFSDFFSNKSESNFFSSYADNLDKVKKMLDPNSDASPLIKPSRFISDKKYPSEKNIIAIFKRFGVDDIFKEVGRLGKKNYRLILKSFSDIRTNLAHQHPPNDLTRQDIYENLKSIKDFVYRLDFVLYWHVRRTSGDAFWM